MSIDIRDARDHSSAVYAAFDGLRDADRRFSTYRDDSEVADVNRGALEPERYSSDLREVLRIGGDAQRASNSAFILRMPGRGMNLDGVVKGWAVARAATLLRGRGVRNFCFNAGGDVVVSGSPGGGARWHVGIRSPNHRTAMLAVLTVSDCAVATSATYERGEHIIDGRTGLPARELASVTVLADSLTTADVLATSVFALGSEGVPWATKNGARGVLAVTSDDDALVGGHLPLARP